MRGARSSLLEDGLATLAKLLPAGYSVEKSSLAKARDTTKSWAVLRGPERKRVTCLLLARRRVERRDLDAVAAEATRTHHPALLLSPLLSPAAREHLRDLGIGYWDLAGNARLELARVALSLDHHAAARATEKIDRRLRSLSGATAGRVVRVLVDLTPPHALAALAKHACVEASYLSRVVASLAEAGWLERRPHGRIATVDWRPILRCWSSDAPLSSRGEMFHFHCARGLSDFLARLAQSGFLHALTGRRALAGLTAGPVSGAAVLYVDDVEAAVSQFGLRPAAGRADVVLVKPLDRSVFHRSREQEGLRYVSPSLMAADLDDANAFEVALDWMARHESTWRR
jgi:hypothetical protein